MIAPDPLRIYLGYDEVSIPDWRRASLHIKAAKGIAVCEVLKAPERVGSIYLPERAQATYYDDEDPVAGFEPSVCCVLAAGDGVPLSPGQLVIVYDGDGVCREGLRFGSYTARGEVRIYGLVHPDGSDEGFLEELPWDESIVGILEAGLVIPTGKNVLLRRDSLEVKTPGGLILADETQERTGWATVERVGPQVTGCKPGDRVIYHPQGRLSFYDASDKDLCMVREKAVLCVLEEAA